VFEPFPRNYNWSLNVNLALSMGAEIGEVNDINVALEPYAEASDEEAWSREWAKLSQRLERLAQRDLEHGHRWTAGRKLLRSAIAEFMAERQRANTDPHKLVSYRRALTLFKEALALQESPVRHVEIPYQGKTLKALYIPAVTEAERAPCLIHFNGLDVTKELVYMMHGYDLPPRGVAAVFVDQPGTGSAIRLDHLTARLDTEVPAGAVVDYLEARPDIDPKRIGIVAISLGGYYAARAAAFEKRIAACICWGGFYSYNWYRAAASKAKREAPSVPPFQWHWVFGSNGDLEQLEKNAGKLTLEGVMQHVTCPLLVLHGENDQQVPVEMAVRTHDEAVNTASRELHIFRRDEGGSQHCQHDNVTCATDYFHDWIVDQFLGKTAGQTAGVTRASRA